MEGDQRLRKPTVAVRGGAPQAVLWKDALLKVRDALNAAGRKDPASVRFLASGHASIEELYLLRRIAEELKGDGGAAHVAVGWRRTPKPQPAGVKFKVPATDAPNLRGAEDLGLPVGAGNDGPADLSELRSAVAAGRVGVLYVVDPGAEGTLGDVAWIVEARQAGTLPVLVYQGVLNGELAKAADVVLPGACSAEKDACYTNEQGRVQASSRAISPPGEAVDDWQILTSVAAALGLPFDYQTSQAVRQDVARTFAARGEGYAELATATFNRPVSAETWLQASNPSERWKWDFMFQDLPPVKGHNVQMEHAPQPTVIPLRVVTEEIGRRSE